MLIHNKDDTEFVTEFPCFWDTLYLATSLNFFCISVFSNVNSCSKPPGAKAGKNGLGPMPETNGRFMKQRQFRKFLEFNSFQNNDPTSS